VRTGLFLLLIAKKTVNPRIAAVARPAINTGRKLWVVMITGPIVEGDVALEVSEDVIMLDGNVMYGMLGGNSTGLFGRLLMLPAAALRR
jgi:hypothetical protein